MNDFLAFRKMITPVAIQILFWLFVVGVIITGFVAMAQGKALAGLVVIIIGPVMVRIYCELLIVAFKIFESLRNIEIQKTSGSAPQAPSTFPDNQQFGQN